MANSYQIIDEKTWNRAIHCAVFRNCVEPAFCVTFEADITNFKRMIKEQGLSFTFAMVYAVCKCANNIEAFRYRFVDGQVALYNKIDTAFTYLNKHTGLFKVVNYPMIDDLKMMFFNVLLCPGLHILIYHTQTPERKIMQHHFLIGENIMKKMEK